MPDEATTQTAEQIFQEVGPHEFIEKMMNEPAPDLVPTEQPQQATEPEAPAAPTVEQLQAELERANKLLEGKEKQNRDQLSDIDRRVNVAVAKAQEQIVSKVESLFQQFAPRAGNPTGQFGQSPEDSYPEGIANSQNVAALIRSEAAKAATEALSKDERVNKASVMTDLAEFRAANPDSAVFDPIFQIAFEELSFVPRNRQGLEELNKFFKRMASVAMANAKAATEAANANKGGASTSPKTLTQQQAQTLAEKAKGMKVEQGVSASGYEAPVINYHTNNLRTEIEKMVRGRLLKP